MGPVRKAHPESHPNNSLQGVTSFAPNQNDNLSASCNTPGSAALAMCAKFTPPETVEFGFVLQLAR
jgi:hypothetical protein